VSSEIKAKYVKISAHVHPTESIEKVQIALSIITGVERETLEKSIRTTTFSGDYGNKIIIMEYRINSRSKIEKFLKRLDKNLIDVDKEYLNKHFNSFYNPKKFFYIRLNKQLLFAGKWRLSSYDDIFHIIIKLSDLSRNKDNAHSEKEVEKDNIQAFLVNTGILI